MAKSLEKNKPLLVAIDDGYAQMKLLGENPEYPSGSGKEISRDFASNATTEILTSVDDGGAPSYETENEDTGTDTVLTVSNLVEGMPTNFNGFHSSSYNRTLVAHTLAQSGFGGKEVELWVSLPVGDYYTKKGQKNEQAIQKKIDSLLKKVRSHDNRELAELVSVKVAPQAVTTIMFCIMDEDSCLRPEYEEDESFYVVDIGGRTTDVACLYRNPDDNSLSYMADRSFSINAGVLDVKAELSELLKERFGIEDDFSPKILDIALREKKIRLGRDYHDIADLCHEASRETASRIISKMRQKMKDLHTTHRVLLTGGGSALFKNDLQGFYSKIEVLNDPEHSNVKGIFLLAKGLRQAASE